MNQWYFDIGMFMILLLLVVGIFICIISIIILSAKKCNKKTAIISMNINLILLVMTILYVASHDTYYKFNDWAILRSNIHDIEEKYGKFDWGKIKENQKGIVGYYIYTDNGAIMPDYLEHYYYIEYDERGIIYNVYDGCQPGG